MNNYIHNLSFTAAKGSPVLRDRFASRTPLVFLSHEIKNLVALFLLALSYKLPIKIEWTYPLGIAEKDDDLSHNPALFEVSKNKRSLTGIEPAFC